MGKHYINEIFNRTEVKKYVKGYGFLSFVRKFDDKYGTKLMDTAKKKKKHTHRGINAAKTASKRVV